MTSNDFEARLRQSFLRETGKPAPDLLAMARDTASARSGRKRIRFGRFLAAQIRFIGWKVWAVQGTALLALCRCLRQLLGNGYWSSPQSAAGLLLCLSVLVFMTIPPFLCRSSRCRMQEVESAAYFSSARLLGARLLIIGLGDISLLSGILLTAAASTSLEPGTAVLSVWFPFLLASSVCLYLLGHVPPRLFLAGSMGMGAAMLLGFALANRRFPFLPSLTPGWIGASSLLLLFCIHQLHQLLRSSTYTQMQLI